MEQVDALTIVYRTGVPYRNVDYSLAWSESDSLVSEDDSSSWSRIWLSKRPMAKAAGQPKIVAAGRTSAADEKLYADEPDAEIKSVSPEATPLPQKCRGFGAVESNNP